jgi:hypothetical protein
MSAAIQLKKLVHIIIELHNSSNVYIISEIEWNKSLLEMLKAKNEKFCFLFTEKKRKKAEEPVNSLSSSSLSLSPYPSLYIFHIPFLVSRWNAMFFLFTLFIFKLISIFSRLDWNDRMDIHEWWYGIINN